MTTSPVRHTPSEHSSPPLSPSEIAEGVQAGNRALLSRALTLVASTHRDDRPAARAVLEHCQPATGGAERIAVTGSPGVGKSTFIETLGARLLEDGRKIAVLAIDPTSERSGGAILGDKTRMRTLTASDRAFVRPSATDGALGGVAAATRASILLCEAAGFDTVFVETVGVGQSESEVRSMVDVFLLFVLPNAGDQLQGIKRGIIEMADVIAVNKADDDDRGAAKAARTDLETALRLFPTPPSGVRPNVLTCSARTGARVNAVWQAVRDFLTAIRKKGFFEQQRREQARHWMHQIIEHRLQHDFFDDARVRRQLPNLEARVTDGALEPAAAAERLLAIYRQMPPE